MIPLNVKYVLLTKEVDFKQYFFLFNQTDLELIKETENFYIFKNKHIVSRFYLSTSPSQDQPGTSFESLNYTQVSPVKFQVNADKGYILFVPPNLDSDYWELEGAPSLTHGFYAVYPPGKGTIYYRRFDTYLPGYAVSLMTLLVLVVWYRKEWVVGILRKSGIFSHISHLIR